jgi:hypothetical protein
MANFHWYQSILSMWLYDAYREILMLNADFDTLK